MPSNTAARPALLRTTKRRFCYLQLVNAELMIDQIGTGRTFDDEHLLRTYPFGKGLNIQIEVPDISPLTSALEIAEITLYLNLEDKWSGKGNMEVGNRQFVVADPDGYLLPFYQTQGTRSK